MVLQLGVIIHFVCNQKEITESACENKETVEMRCNGKCQMTRAPVKTNQKDDAQSSLPEFLIKSNELHPFISKSTENIFYNKNNHSLVSFFHITTPKISFGFFSEIFHPPLFR